MSIFQQRAQIEPEPEEEVSVFEERAQKDPQFPEKEVFQQALIGGAKGLFGTYGNILDLIRAQTKSRLTPGHQELAKAELEAPESLLPWLQEEDIMPRYTRLPTGEEVEEFGEMMGLAPEPVTPQGRVARRIAEPAGGALAFGLTGAPLATAALAGGAGGIVEEESGSPLAGTVVELAGNIGGLMRGGLAAGGKRGAYAKTLKELGFNEAERTLLSQGEGRLNFLGKIASKDAKTKKLLDSIYARSSNIYDGLRKMSPELGNLEGANLENMTRSLADVFNNLTPGQQKVAMKTLEEFAESPINFKSMMDVVHDLNADFSKLKGGKKAVLALKEPLVQGMKDLNPEAGGMFNDIQGAYADFKKISKKMTPGMVDKILDASELIALAKSLISFTPGLFVKTLGMHGARKLAREFLINPKLQGLTLKAVKAAKEGKVALANKLVKKINERIKAKKEPTEPEELQSEELEKIK